MESPVYLQLAQAAAALIMGGAIGLLYDVLKTIRLKTKYKTLAGLIDLLFWLVALISLFALGMTSGGGDIRIFMLVAALCGAVLYMIGPSPAVLEILNFLADLIGRTVRLCLKPMGKIKKEVQKAKILKKYLSISNKIVYNNKNQNKN